MGQWLLVIGCYCCEQQLVMYLYMSIQFGWCVIINSKEIEQGQITWEIQSGIWKGGVPRLLNSAEPYHHTSFLSCVALFTCITLYFWEVVFLQRFSIKISGYISIYFGTSFIRYIIQLVCNCCPRNGLHPKTNE